MERRRDVVDVVRDSAEQVTVGVAVEVAERQPRELLLDLAPQSVDGALRDAGHDVGLRPREERREDVHEHRNSEDPCERREVDALPGDRVGSCEQVRELTLALCTQELDGLLLRNAGRERSPDDAVEDHVHGVPRDLRTDHAEHDAQRAEHDDRGDHRPLGTKAREQLPERASEILGAFDGRAEAHEWPPALAGLRPPAGAATLGPARHHHAAAAPSCDSTISRYSALVSMSSAWVPLPTTRPSSSTTM